LGHVEKFRVPISEQVFQFSSILVKCQKQFYRSNTDIVKYSQDQFGFKLPSELIPNRTAKFRPIAKLELQASDCV